MSLAVLADHMASKGRGNDSMLVHMTPREVAGLQALAKAHGGSLTINPDTGLPEAGWVDKLLPTIIGAGISFFSGGAINPLQAAAIVGGIQTVRTGDIGRGLAAGLGAYGGAGLTAGMTAAGESAIGSQAAGQSYLASSVPSVLEGAGAGLSADMAYNLGQAGIDTAGAEASRLAQQAAAERIAAASPFDKLSAGAKAVSDNPMSFANKDNLKYLAAAAGPAIMAGMNVQAKGPQTVTKPGMIRPYSYDPYSGGFIAASPYEAAPTRAAEGGLMGMDDGGYSPGMLDFAQRSEPVLRMANGGVAHFDGGGITDAQIVDYFKSGPKSDEQIARDMDTYKVTAADIARATGTQNRLSEYENRYAAANTKNDIYDYFAKADTQSLLKSGNDKAIADTLQANDWKLADVAAATGTQNLLGDYGTRYVNAVSDRATDSNEFLARAADVGLTGADLATALQNSGMSAAAQYALTHNLSDAGGVTGTGFYSNLGYTKGSLPGDQGGLEGLYANINYSAAGLQRLIDSGKMTVAQAQDAALAEMQRSGTSLADVKAATGKSFGDLFKPKTIVDTKTKIDTITGGTGNDVVKPPPFTSVVPGGSYGRPDGSTPGDITTNKDGTVTVHPNIPYRPPGGFSGMGEVRDAYTKGGGSLGYIPYAPKTIEEFDAKYGFKTPSGSKQSYDYLMGKTPYSPTPYTPTGEVMKPYAESVLGMPANLSKRMYIFDPATKTYKINPDYAIPTYDKDGNKTYNLTNKDVITYMATKPAPTDFYNWVKTNNLTVEQIATATGMPITEVQKMLTGGTPKDTASDTSNVDTTQGGGSGGDGLAAGGLSAINMARGGISGSGNLDLHIPLDFGDSGGGGGYTPMGGGFSSDGGFSSGVFNGQNNTAGGGFGSLFNSLGMSQGLPLTPTASTSNQGSGLGAVGSGTSAAYEAEILKAKQMGFDFSPASRVNGDDFVPRTPHQGTFADARKLFGMATGGITGYAAGGQYDLGDYSDGGRLLRGPGDGVSDSIPASIGNKRPARLADGEFVVPARIVSELGNGSTEAGARKLYAMMDRIQAARRGTVGKDRVAKNSRADKHLPA